MRSTAPGAGPEPTSGGSSSGTLPGPPPAAPTGALPPPDSPYWTFYDEVALRQVSAWAPRTPGLVLDVSGTTGPFAQALAAAGHRVVQVRSGPPGGAGSTPGAAAPEPDVPVPGPGRVVPVRAEATSFGWLRDGCVDAVLAESRALSLCLAAEVTVDDLARVLRPGGRLLLVVDSLAAGLARLAEQGRWAELADVPSADVVLVPAADTGAISRCFWPEELAGLLGAAGLQVEWVRPRTVLTPAAVERAVRHGGRAAGTALAAAELAVAESRTGESAGLHLVASAVKPV